MKEYLFVYGTLRMGINNPYSQLLSSSARQVGAATVMGRLYNIGEYPGAIPDETTTFLLKGELYELDESLATKVLMQLDRYEGYSPRRKKASEFYRAKTIAYTEDGTAVYCWIYWYNHSLRGKKRIYEGDYVSFARNRNRISA